MDTSKRPLTGQGAQGDLWLAEDSSNNNNRVALKILKNFKDTDLERFRREAQCASKIVSPHVARIWDWGSSPEPFITFEYVEGHDLGDIVPIRNMAEHLRIAVGIVAGLRAIHDEGIAHRDIKSENVRYEGGGHVKIVDLGIALSRGQSRMTEVASVPGTYGWMAPERRTKGPLDVHSFENYDPRADSYAQIIEQVSSLNTDAIVLIGFADDTAKILREMIDAGIGPESKRVYGTEGNMRSTLAGQVNPNDPGVIAGMKGTNLPPEASGFTERLRGSPGGGGLAEFAYSAEVYDAVIIASLAALTAGTDAPAAISHEINGITQGGEPCTSYEECFARIQAGIDDIDYNGVSGDLEFNDAGEPCVANCVVSEFNDEGVLVSGRTASTSNRCVTFTAPQNSTSGP